ncbi:MAG: peptide chain release factor N(5)-glutamine methyltransferase [Rhodothermales bacterium]
MRYDPARSRLEHVMGDAIRLLAREDIEDARRNVEWMLCELLGVGRASLYAYPERILTAGETEALTRMLERRAGHEPLQHILGHTEFMGLRIAVSPDVLIPRHETELLVEYGLADIEGKEAPRVLDIGTGSGCIPIALKHRRPDARVFACDISEPALRIARENGAVAQTPIVWHRLDILADTLDEGAGAPFDLILSNPPYIPMEDGDSLQAEVSAFEPHLALFPGEDPLVFYRAIAGKARPALRPGGSVIVEIYSDFADQVSACFAEAGFTRIRVLDDLAGRARFVHVRTP